MPRAITAEQQEIIKVASIEGYNAAVIAKLLNLSPITVRKYKRKFKLRSLYRLTAGDKREIVRLGAKGWSITEIAKKKKIGRHTVSKVLREKNGGSKNGRAKCCNNTEKVSSSS